MRNIIIGQILGLLVPVITFFSYQVNSKRLLLLLQTLATVTTCISYFFLGASSGFLLNIVCVIRNFIFFFQKSQSGANLICATLLSVIMGALGLLIWEGPITILLMLGLAANTMFISFGDAQLLRKSVLVTSSMILVYNLCIPHPSIGGAINESVAIVASIVGIIVFIQKKKQGEALPSESDQMEKESMS